MPKPPPLLRHCLAVPVALLALALAVPGAGVEAPKKFFDLPAGEAASALKSFSVQSGEQIVYPVDQVRGILTHAVRGEWTARAALEHMLAGTALRVVQDEQTGALAIRRAAEPAPARPSSAPAPEAAAAVAPKPRAASDEIVQLNPFEVRTDPDNSYGALDSNSLTAFRIALEKMPATTSILTRTFMDDVAATSIEEALLNYSGMVGFSPGNASAAVEMAGDRDSGGSGNFSIRGLAGSPIKRDGFIGVNVSARTATGHTDNFSIERVEIVEGPQSLLYGAVGGGGVVNAVSKRALFGLEKGFTRFTVDQYGSKRALFDYNLGRGPVAVRLVALGSTDRNVRLLLGGDSYGLYTQLAFRLGRATTLRLFRESTSHWANVGFTPNLNNFFAPADPRRGKDARYLALTGQLGDLGGAIDGGIDYRNVNSFGAWWSSERIANHYNGVTLDTALPYGLSAQLSAIYSETVDDRFTNAKNLLPAAGLPNAGTNPFNATAVQLNPPGDNWQSERIKGVRFTLLHEGDFFGGRVHTQTALGVEGSHQGPAFASSGIDYRYYQADAQWNPIINPTLKVDYGRVPLDAQYYPVQNGIPSRPLFQPGSTRITLNGVNYVRQARIAAVPALATPDNPFGLVPNNPTTNPNGFSGAWNRGGETHDRLAYLSNFTDWFGGRFTTLVGVSVDRFTTLNSGAGALPTLLPWRSYSGYEIGLNYRVRPALRVYATLGTAGMSAGTTKDFYGQALKVPKAKSPTPEIGLKYHTADGRFAAQLACNFTTAVQNETRNAGLDFFNAVNPNGINGRYNSGDQWTNLDRKASSTELTLTATPTRQWRMRLVATRLDGEITSTVSYRQLYNDQFYTRGTTVTYQDGTPVLVDPTGGSGAKTDPLTLAMINDPTNAFYANPDPESGSIVNPTLKTALTAVDPAHGAAATGVTGLPLSAMQYDFANPHQGVITLYQAGEKNTGFNEYSLNFQNHYAFDRGGLKGLSVFCDVRTYWENRAYYTSYFSATSTSALRADRQLYRLPTATVVGLGVSYQHRLSGKYTWTTRLNLNNLFNHYRVWVMPSASNGASLVARLSAPPRQFLWSNTIDF